MKARLHLCLQRPDGTVLDERHASNTVMVSGAQLIADLFAGAGSAITHMGVGTNAEDPDDVEVTALSNVAVDDSPPLQGSTLGPIAPDSFTTTVIRERRVVQVRVRATLPSDAAVGMVREAGLVSEGVSGTVLYNRVVFAPIDKRDDHELTLFWEVEFPYGELQWLT